MIFTAQEARNLQDKYMEEHIRSFNTCIQEQIKDDPATRKIHLYFDQWGYDWTDVQFIVDAGYSVTRNRVCLWWEVTW